MTVVPGLVSVTFRGLSAPEVVSLAAAHGMRAIEWGGDVHVPVGEHRAARDVAVRCAAEDIAIAAYGSYYRAGGTGDFEPVLATALSLGAPRIRVWAGEVGSAYCTRRDEVVADLRRIAALAAEEGVDIAVEYHANTLTDTLSSALDLFAAAPVVPYWQPPIGVSIEDAHAAVAALLPNLVTAHVFTWTPTGERLPLAAGETLWHPVLAALAATPGTRYALLEFVRDDAQAAFAEDAATLHSWL